MAGGRLGQVGDFALYPEQGELGLEQAPDGTVELRYGINSTFRLQVLAQNGIQGGLVWLAI